MAKSEIIDVTQLIDDQKIRPFNVLLVGLLFLTVLLDGYDIVGIAYAGPALIKEWGIDRSALGPLFGAAAFAGLFGPPILGYLADRYGRRPALVGGTLFFSAFILGSVWTTSLTQLIVLRFIATLGLSGVLAIATALTSEFAPRRVRITLFILMFSGITFGGGLPGLIAAKYMAVYGWRILFWIGGLLPILVALALVFFLPESVKFLVLRPQRRNELVRILKRIKPDLAIGPATQFMLAAENNRAKFSMGALFEGKLAIITPLLWIANLSNLTTVLFVQQWTPTLLAGAGVSVAHATLATTIFQFAGTLCGLLIMRPLDKYGFLPVPILIALSIPVVAGIGLPGLSEFTVITLVGLSGFGLLGLQFGIIGSEANLFPTYIRSSGVGSCFAAGRVGSAFGPMVAGILLGMHMSQEYLFYVATIPLIIGFIATAILTPMYKTRVLRAQAEELAARAAPAE